MRVEIANLLRAGRMPLSSRVDENTPDYPSLINAIERPITIEEAKVLISIFGPDDCFGVAWSLLHLIETAPYDASFFDDISDSNDSEDKWIERLKRRFENGIKFRENSENEGSAG